MPEAAARQPEPDVGEAARLSRRERRDALLDAAVELVTSGDVASVSMEAVAERARVGPPPLYKHFRNRSALHAADERGRVFAALRSAGGWNRELRHEQRARDVDTVRAFAARAERELGIDR